VYIELDVNSPQEPNDDRAELIVIKAIIDDFKLSGLFELKVTSDIPIGAGLGSSASYSCALASAILKASGLSANLAK
jgi:shikimate kinase